MLPVFQWFRKTRRASHWQSIVTRSAAMAQEQHAGWRLEPCSQRRPFMYEAFCHLTHKQCDVYPNCSMFRSGALLIYMIFLRDLYRKYQWFNLFFLQRPNINAPVVLLLWLQTCDITFHTVPLRHYCDSVTLFSACVIIISDAYSNVRSVRVKRLWITIHRSNAAWFHESFSPHDVIWTSSHSTFAFNLLCF